MNSRKLKAAIIGYGKMGKIRASCVKERSDMEVTAVCEINAASLPTDIPSCRNYEDILQFKPDVVFACTDLPRRNTASTTSCSVSNGTCCPMP